MTHSRLRQAWRSSAPPATTTSTGFQRIASHPLHSLQITLGRPIPCSDVAQQRQKIIRKRVALHRDESVSVVTVGTAPAQTGDPTHAHLHHWQ
jgi:hypothetical protein